MSRCVRCGAVNVTTIMSRFNTDTICLPCQEVEKRHPRYQAAVEAELAALKAGQFNYAGIGRPADLLSRLDGVAVSSGELLKPPGVVSFNNNVGGTNELPAGRYRVRVIGGFDDDETGRVIHARIVDPAQVEIARKAGSVHQPDWKIPRLPDGHAETAFDTYRVFDPSFVMFHASEGVWFPGEAS